MATEKILQFVLKSLSWACAVAWVGLNTWYQSLYALGKKSFMNEGNQSTYPNLIIGELRGVISIHPFISRSKLVSMEDY